MPETILCGVDESDAAAGVVGAACWLADQLEARLVLIHVSDEPMRDADGVVASIRDRLALGSGVDLHSTEGAPAQRLIDEVKHLDADLLVVGSRGRGPIGSAVFGSVSRTLVTGAPCPVVVVPPRVKPVEELSPGDPSIICGVDGSLHAIAAARLAGLLAERLGLSLVIVHALPDVKSVVSYPGARSTAPPLSGQPDARDRLAEELVRTAADAAGKEATTIVEPGLPWDVLEAVADRQDGRLLVIAARGQSDLRAAVLGSAAHQLASSSNRPVVVLPEEAEGPFGDAEAN